MDMHPLVRRWTTSLPALIVFAALVLMWRRPVELHHPYMWVEEGTVSLPAYLALGWRSLWVPVAGYIVLPAKLIFLTAISLSASHSAGIAYWLTLIFEIGTICLVAYSPTHLRYPKLAAIAIALIPTHPEVFAVSEYAFWWGIIWSFVALFWREGENPRTLWRSFLVVFGGLSSPMALPVAAFLGYRAFRERKRTDWIVFGAGVVVAAVQCIMVATASVPMGFGTRQFDGVQVVVRFFGNFVVSTGTPPVIVLFLLGAAIIAAAIYFVISRRKWNDTYFVLIGAGLCAGILAAITRVPVDIIHPVLAGPRYFFYPFIFLAWALLYIYSETGVRFRAFIGVVLLLALSQFAMHGRFEYDTFHWRAELKRCVAEGAGTYQFPVQFAGPKEIAWHVPLTGVQCQSLVDRSLLK